MIFALWERRQGLIFRLGAGARRLGGDADRSMEMRLNRPCPRLLVLLALRSLQSVPRAVHQHHFRQLPPLFAGISYYVLPPWSMLFFLPPGFSLEQSRPLMHWFSQHPFGICQMCMRLLRVGLDYPSTLAVGAYS